MSYSPKVFTKDGSTRVAYSPSDEVALTFEGYKAREDAPAPAPVDPPQEPVDTEQPEAVKPGKAPKAPKPSIFDDKD